MIILIGAGDSSAKCRIRQLDSKPINLEWSWCETAHDELAVNMSRTVQVTVDLVRAMMMASVPGVATGSWSWRFRASRGLYPVATAPGTDLIAQQSTKSHQ